MRTFIIDDEPQIRQGLCILLQDTETKIIGEAASIQEALALLPQANPEVVLLDIQLLDGNAFDLLDYLPRIDFKIVFITSYNEYALKAFKYNAFDYLLKPIDPTELHQTLERLKSQKISSQVQLEAMKNNTELDKLVIRSSDGIHTIPLDKIRRCQSDGGYTHFYLTDGDHILSSKTLKEYANLLPDHSFVRVHQSHLVRWSCVTSYSTKGILILDNGDQIPVSVRRRTHVKARFQ